MADDADRAAHLEEQARADFMARQQAAAERQAMAPRPQPRGMCWNPLCELDLEDSQALFCGPVCSHEYQREKAA